ncbi:hypothetical protein BC629DRAFT_14026 [Irpex lacteus]|nr:hypothetical protein BC629DRAFT_14026 [Irpex lacteus]
MKLFAGFTVLVAASSGLAQDFLIDTPIGGVLQCVPIEIVWVGGTGPFDLIFTSDVVDALQIYRKIPKSPFLWSANVTAGTRLVMSLLDEANGNESISGNFSVSDSGDSSCLNRDSSSTSSKLGSTDRESHTSSATSTTLSSASLTTTDSAGITASSNGTSQSSPLPSRAAQYTIFWEVP